jgi:hypothetical protein
MALNKTGSSAAERATKHPIAAVSNGEPAHIRHARQHPESRPVSRARASGLGYVTRDDPCAESACFLTYARTPTCSGSGEPQASVVLHAASRQLDRGIVRVRRTVHQRRSASLSVPILTRHTSSSWMFERKSCARPWPDARRIGAVALPVLLIAHCSTRYSAASSAPGRRQQQACSIRLD